jgi:hypothetical protein
VLLRPIGFTGRSSKVPLDVVAKDVQGRTYEANDAVGMVTGTATVNRRASLDQSV